MQTLSRARSLGIMEKAASKSFYTDQATYDQKQQQQQQRKQHFRAREPFKPLAEPPSLVKAQSNSSLQFARSLSSSSGASTDTAASKRDISKDVQDWIAKRETIRGAFE